MITAAIDLAYTAFWIAFPFVAIPYAGLIYARRVWHGTDRDHWVDAWAGRHEDVAAIDAELAQMVAR